jgi:hypothetical protein
MAFMFKPGRFDLAIVLGFDEPIKAVAGEGLSTTP